MNSSTSAQLQAVNRAFYRHHAASFDRTRQRPWPGWQKLVSLCDRGPRPLRVLDAGCGNGRFGVFLADQLGGQEIHYCGIDSSEELLRAATEVLPHRFGHCELAQQDLLKPDLDQWLTGKTFDWIVLFGVLHHLPGFANRARLVRHLGRHLHRDGLLALSLWRFDRDPRQARKLLPWPGELAGIPLDQTQLEPGDHLLSWTGDSHQPRFCHAINEAEAERLVAATGLWLESQLTDTDGPGGGGNDYLVLAPNTAPGP